MIITERKYLLVQTEKQVSKFQNMEIEILEYNKQMRR